MLQPRKVSSAAVERRSRHQAYNFSARNFHSAQAGLGVDSVEGPGDRRLFVVRQVHRNLNQPARLQFKAKRLHERQAAATFADRASDTTRDCDVICSQVDIERNQKWTRAHGNCAGCRMGSFLAYVRRAIGIRFDLSSKLLDPFATHFLQTDTIRSQRRALVKINRNRKLLPNAPPCFMGQGRSEEHTSELQSRLHLVCRLLLEKKKKTHEHTAVE